MRTESEELRVQIAAHYARFAQITLAIGAQDGGSRTHFRFLDDTGTVLTQWEDWSLTLDEIERELRKSWSGVHCEGMGYTYTFHVRERHRTPTLPEPRP